MTLSAADQGRQTDAAVLAVLAAAGHEGATTAAIGQAVDRSGAPVRAAVARLVTAGRARRDGSRGKVYALGLPPAAPSTAVVAAAAAVVDEIAVRVDLRGDRAAAAATMRRAAAAGIDLRSPGLPLALVARGTRSRERLLALAAELDAAPSRAALNALGPLCVDEAAEAGAVQAQLVRVSAETGRQRDGVSRALSVAGPEAKRLRGALCRLRALWAREGRHGDRPADVLLGMDVDGEPIVECTRERGSDNGPPGMTRTEVVMWRFVNPRPADVTTYRSTLDSTVTVDAADLRTWGPGTRALLRPALARVSAQSDAADRRVVSLKADAAGPGALGGDALSVLGAPAGPGPPPYRRPRRGHEHVGPAGAPRFLSQPTRQDCGSTPASCTKPSGPATKGARASR